MQSRLTLGLAAAALVVAVLGSTPLGHAVASNVPRNSVGPLELKRNAVTARKISPNAVRTAHVLDGTLLAGDFKPGQLPAGPKGDKGDKGDPGVAGPAGVTAKQVILAKSASDSNSPKTAQATCPAGKQAISGGAQIDGVLGPAISSSRPLGNTAWFVFAYEVVAAQGAWSVSSYVICAKVS